MSERPTVSRVLGPIRAHLAGVRPMLSRLLRGTAWTAVSGVLNQGGTLATSVVAARLLGEHGFGQYAIVLSTLMSIASVAQTGLGFASTKYIAEFRSVDKRKTGRILGLCNLAGNASAVLFALLLAAGARLLSGKVLGADALTGSVAIGGLFVMFAAVNSQQVAALTRLERYQAMAMPSALCTLVTIAAVYVGSLARGVEGAIAGLSVAMALRCYCFRRVLMRELHHMEIPVSYAGIRGELATLYRFALPAAFSGYSIMAGLCFGNALLVHQPDGYKHMAHYSAALSLRTIVMFAPLMMNSVGLAILNNVRRAAVAGTDASVWWMNICLLTGTTAVLSVLARLFGPLALHMYGKEFAEADTSILTFLLVSAVLEAALLSFFQRIQSQGRMWTALLGMTLPWQAVFSFAAFLLVPRFAATGLAAAHLAGMLSGLLGTVLIVASMRQSAAVEGPSPEPLELETSKPSYSPAQV